MADVEVQVPHYTNIEIQVDISDYLATITGEIDSDDILDNLDECSTEDVLDRLAESEVIEWAVNTDPSESLEKLLEHDPSVFDNDARLYRFVIEMFKRLPVTAQLASMCHLGHPMMRALDMYTNRHEAEDAVGLFVANRGPGAGYDSEDVERSFDVEAIDKDFLVAVRRLIRDAEMRQLLIEELGAFHAENQRAYCPINQLHLFTKEEMTNGTQDQ